MHHLEGGLQSFEIVCVKAVKNTDQCCTGMSNISLVISNISLVISNISLVISNISLVISNISLVISNISSVVQRVDLTGGDNCC